MKTKALKKLTKWLLVRYRVYTFKSNDSIIQKPISQIFVENQNGQIGTVYSYFCGIHFGTMHKPARYTGTGFGKLIKGEDFNNPSDIDIIFSTYPYWANSYTGTVKKYKSFEDYVKHQHGILDYYELN